MENNGITKKIKITGMTCVNCENRIENELKNTPGIEAIKVCYSDNSAHITYDSEVITMSDITKIIERIDYKVQKMDTPKAETQSGVFKIAGIVIILLAGYIIMGQLGLTNLFNAFPQAEAGMGYGVLFLIGLLTSVHCIAMCGGINISQCMTTTAGTSKPVNVLSQGSSFAFLRPSALYNLGRVSSYTLIGGVVGALGSVISFTDGAKGIVQLIAGVFMVIMGLNMLNVFSWLRRFNPRMPKVFARIISEKKRGASPFFIGLLNGFMPCGPLQAMQLYALSTGDPVKGALSMFLFSLGTVPLMFGLGALSSILSQRFAKKVMSVGAVVVVLLGISMFNSGVSLSGFVMGGATASESTSANTAKVESDVQMIQTTLDSGRYQPITVKAGIPVKWTISAEEGTINGCNNRMFIPEYQIEQKLEYGDNVIEFTPGAAGTYPYSCWMGMIRSTITVVE